MNKHTPGPWTVISKQYSFLVNQGRKRSSIEICHGDTDINIPLYGTREQAEADARLIAAAPDMLVALKMAFKIPKPWIMGGRTITEEEWNAAVDAVTAAIAKAEGIGE